MGVTGKQKIISSKNQLGKIKAACIYRLNRVILQVLRRNYLISTDSLAQDKFEPHRTVRLTGVIDQTLFVAHLMQLTNSALVCRIFHICALAALVIYMCPGRSLRRAWSASLRKAAAAAAAFHELLDTFPSYVSVIVTAMV